MSHAVGATAGMTFGAESAGVKGGFSVSYTFTTTTKNEFSNALANNVGTSKQVTCGDATITTQ